MLKTKLKDLSNIILKSDKDLVDIDPKVAEEVRKYGDKPININTPIMEEDE